MRQPDEGFTIVEVIVAIVVAVLFLSIIIQLYGYISAQFEIQRRHAVASIAAYNNLQKYTSLKNLETIGFNCNNHKKGTGILSSISNPPFVYTLNTPVEASLDTKSTQFITEQKLRVSTRAHESDRDKYEYPDLPDCPYNSIFIESIVTYKQHPGSHQLKTARVTSNVY